MPIDDLWFLRRRDPATGNRLPSRRHGRGKRWRVRWIDPETGRKREQLFAKKSDAERHDANMHADISRGVYVDPAAGRTTVREYGDQWRRQQLHRDSTAERTERTLRLHVYPLIGDLAMSQVRPSHLRGWVKDRAEHLQASTLAVVYGGVLVPLFASAVADRIIGRSPCTGVKLPDIPGAEHYIVTAEQVRALHRALPERYRAIVYVAAGCGLRGGEVFGLELEHIDFLRRQVHVCQQLKVVSGRRPFLAPVKTKTSVRTVDLPQVTAAALARHLEKYPAMPVEVDDETDTRHRRRRTARLVFTNVSGQPIHRASWSHDWRPAVASVGDMPPRYGLHGLRHYYSTVLIHGGANVKHVQLALGHASPMITLNTYLAHWPDVVTSTRSLLDAALDCAEDVPMAAASGSAAGQEATGGGDHL